MRTFAIAALFATVQAVDNFMCTQPATPWAEDTNAAVGAAKTSTACEAACKAVAEDDAKDGNDYCCHFVATTKIEKVEEVKDAEDNVTTAAVAGRDATNVCTLLMLATTDATDFEIMDAKAAADGVSYNAWSWNAGASVGN